MFFGYFCLVGFGFFKPEQLRFIYLGSIYFRDKWDSPDASAYPGPLTIQTDPEANSVGTYVNNSLNNNDLVNLGNL